MRFRWSCSLCSMAKSWTYVGRTSDNTRALFKEQIAEPRESRGAKMVKKVKEKPDPDPVFTALQASCRLDGKHCHQAGLKAQAARCLKRSKVAAVENEVDVDDGGCPSEADKTYESSAAHLPAWMREERDVVRKQAVLIERRKRPIPDAAAGVVNGAMRSPVAHVMGVSSAHPSARGLQTERAQQLDSARPWLEPGSRLKADTKKRLEALKRWCDEQQEMCSASMPALTPFVRKLGYNPGGVQVIMEEPGGKFLLVVQTYRQGLEMALADRAVMSIDGSGMGSFTDQKKIMVYTVQGNNRVYRRDKRAPKPMPFGWIVTVNDRHSETLAAGLAELKSLTERAFNTTVEFDNAVMDLDLALFRAVRKTWRRTGRFVEYMHGRDVWLGVMRKHKIGLQPALVLIAWWYCWLGSRSDMEDRSWQLLLRAVILAPDTPLRLTKKARDDFNRFASLVLFAYPEAFLRRARQNLPKEFLGPGLVECIYKLLKHDYGRKQRHGGRRCCTRVVEVRGCCRHGEVRCGWRPGQHTCGPGRAQEERR